VGSTPGNDTNLSLKKVEGNRNFANKIWNAAEIRDPFTPFITEELWGYLRTAILESPFAEACLGLAGGFDRGALAESP
jgi:valyl-tRNA synthetase